MTTYKKSIKSIKSDIRRIEAQDEKLSAFFVDRYRERFIDAEKEKKVLLNRLTSITKGKSIILENKH